MNYNLHFIAKQSLYLHLMDRFVQSSCCYILLILSVSLCHVNFKSIWVSNKTIILRRSSNMSAGHSSIFELNFFGWLNSNQKQRQPQRKRIMFDDCKTDDPVVSIRNSGNGAKKFFFRKRMISNSVLTSSKHFAELKRENGRKMERRPSTSSLPAVSFNKCTSISRSREDRKGEL